MTPTDFLLVVDLAIDAAILILLVILVKLLSLLVCVAKDHRDR